MTITVGKQPGKGISNQSIYNSVENRLSTLRLPPSACVVDVGGGAGNFTKRLLGHFDQVQVLDCEIRELGPRVKYLATDLNGPWPLSNCSMQFLVSLEVIEHVENPRHFMREVARVLSPGGLAIITTPNQISWSSKACLLLRNQFQHFQASCYPAHITALLPYDFERIAKEVGLDSQGLTYTHAGRIPLTRFLWQDILPFLGGKRFSDTLIASFAKPGVLNSSVKR